MALEKGTTLEKGTAGMARAVATATMGTAATQIAPFAAVTLASPPALVYETENGTDDIWWILEGWDYPGLWWGLFPEN